MESYPVDVALLDTIEGVSQFFTKRCEDQSIVMLLRMVTAYQPFTGIADYMNSYLVLTKKRFDICRNILGQIIFFKSYRTTMDGKRHIAMNMYRYMKST